MSEYNILLKPTRIDEKWYEVPRITTCGVTKDSVKTWQDVIECAKTFDYNILDEIIYKHLNKDTSIMFTIDNKVFINKYKIIELDYNKMVLFILLLENKL